MAPQESSEKKSNTVLLILLVVGGLVVLGVVAVFVLVGLGAYGATRYVQKAKSAEAKSTLGAILSAAERAHASSGTLCASASAPVPASLSAVSGKKYMSAPAEWEVDKAKNAGFACLGFSMSMPQYYQYKYEVSGDTVTVTATGDLNGDGKPATFIARAKVVGGSFQRAPALEEHDPFE